LLFFSVPDFLSVLLSLLLLAATSFLIALALVLFLLVFLLLTMLGWARLQYGSGDVDHVFFSLAYFLCETFQQIAPLSLPACFNPMPFHRGKMIRPPCKHLNTYLFIQSILCSNIVHVHVVVGISLPAGFCLSAGAPSHSSHCDVLTTPSTPHRVPGCRGRSRPQRPSRAQAHSKNPTDLLCNRSGGMICRTSNIIFDIHCCMFIPFVWFGFFVCAHFSFLNLDRIGFSPNLGPWNGPANGALPPHLPPAVLSGASTISFFSF